MDPRERIVFIAIFLAYTLIAMAAGAFAYKKFFSDTSTEKAETFAPQKHWNDGTVTAAKVIDEKPKFAAPSHPKGSKVARTLEFTVKPKPVVVPATAGCPERVVECPTIEGRVDLTRDDTGYRSNIKFDDAEVLDAVEYPVEKFQVLPKNGLGVMEFSDKSQLIHYDRRFGRVDGSLGVLAPSGFGSRESIVVGAGVTFHW